MITNFKNLKYDEFLKQTDSNFSETAELIKNHFKTLVSNYMVDKDSFNDVKFKALYGTTDDVQLYENWLYDFNLLSTSINELIDVGLNQNDIINADYESFDKLNIVIPEQLCLSDGLIEIISNDWQAISELFNQIDKSFNMFGLIK